MIIAIDQSTSATKAMLFTEELELIKRVNIPHKQIYPHPSWVEHDPEEIYNNTIKAIRQLLSGIDYNPDNISLSITNQRETLVIWDKHTGKPIYNAVVWQCMRGEEICMNLKFQGYEEIVQPKTGLLIDPYFSASGAKWILEHVEAAKDKSNLLMGTIDSWLIYKMTKGKQHVTDYTNACRTLLFNINTLDWDDELLRIFGVERSMLPKALACDEIFGETDLEGILPKPIKIAGVLGDSHGALVGQMCFEAGQAKATFGTGSSAMMNIGTSYAAPPKGLVTSIGFACQGKVYYVFEGNVHCTGMTMRWLIETMHMADSIAQTAAIAESVSSTDGVYLVPAFVGLGAPWWKSDVRAAIVGMTLSTKPAHIIRAGLESIAYQVRDLLDAMTKGTGMSLKQLNVDGGPTSNSFLMSFQASQLHHTIHRSKQEEASAMGAVIMNGFALGRYKSFNELKASPIAINPDNDIDKYDQLYKGWLNAIRQLTK